MAAPPPRPRKERHQRERGERRDEAAKRQRRRHERREAVQDERRQHDHRAGGGRPSEERREPRRSRSPLEQPPGGEQPGADERQHRDRDRAPPKDLASALQFFDREMHLEQRRAVGAGDRERLRPARVFVGARRSVAGVAATGPNDVISCQTGAADVVRMAGASSVSAAATPMRLPSSSIGSIATRRRPPNPCAGNTARGPASRSVGQVLRRAVAPGEHAIRAARAGRDVDGRRDAVRCRCPRRDPSSARTAARADRVRCWRFERARPRARRVWRATRSRARARTPSGARRLEMPAGRLVARAEAHELPAERRSLRAASAIARAVTKSRRGELCTGSRVSAHGRGIDVRIPESRMLYSQAPFDGVHASVASRTQARRAHHRRQLAGRSHRIHDRIPLQARAGRAGHRRRAHGRRRCSATTCGTIFGRGRAGGRRSRDRIARHARRSRSRASSPRSALVAVGGGIVMFVVKAGTLAVLVDERARGGRRRTAVRCTSTRCGARTSTTSATVVDATRAIRPSSGLLAAWLSVVVSHHRVGVHLALGVSLPRRGGDRVGAGVAAAGARRDERERRRVTAINLAFDLLRVIVVTDDCRIRDGDRGGCARFVVADARQVLGIFGVVGRARCCGDGGRRSLATAGLTFVAWVPIVGAHRRAAAGRGVARARPRVSVRRADGARRRIRRSIGASREPDSRPLAAPLWVQTRMTIDYDTFFSRAGQSHARVRHPPDGHRARAGARHDFVRARLSGRRRRSRGRRSPRSRASCSRATTARSCSTARRAATSRCATRSSR